jgi:hypothetical protein
MYRKRKYIDGGELLKKLFQGDPSSIGGDMGYGMGSPLQMAGSIGASFIPTGSVGGKAGAGALQGASTGLAFGPIGAGIGAVAGGLTGLISGISEKKQEDEMKQRRRESDERRFNISSRAILSNYPTQGVATSGFYKQGGNLRTGSDIDNLYMTGGYMKPMANGVSEARGRSHNDGGINLYQGFDNFAEIEDGETVKQDKVYSDTLRVPDFAMKALGMYKTRRK